MAWRARRLGLAGAIAAVLVGLTITMHWIAERTERGGIARPGVVALELLVIALSIVVLVHMFVRAERERLLIALERAETAVAERSQELAHVARTAIVAELAAALAHEIRQPLTAILINSQTAMRVLDARPRDPDAVREILQQLAADGHRAAEVVQRVRAFARKAEVERGPVDLNVVVREAVQLVRHDTIRRQVEIRLAFGAQPLVVVGDRVQLQQVVLNLVLNALDALAEHPSAAERLVTLETTRTAHAGLLTVCDTGPGIPAERQATIFEPFVTTKRTGLGMGLPISRIIIEAHGGSIRCESEPPAPGATFMVELPLAGATAR